ncbi:LD30746p [Strongyloides ratti]|uniref:LD30746p n=1 Tax=Strongyloides ratti TaxID=34506 RepID=A0A090LSB5_STRRB|nr:LD30746p [Strongyloides ratti]CEF71102.1 LD30746p [Strongyloides ratti]
MYSIYTLILINLIYFLGTAQASFSNYDEVGLSILVPARGRECFYQRVTDPKYKYIEFSYQVISGGDLDVDVKINGPHSEEIITDTKQSDGTHKIDVTAENRGHGDYSICIDNSFSYQTSKLVYVEVYMLDHEGRYGEMNKLSNGALSSLSDKISNFDMTSQNIKEKLNIIQQDQQHLRIVEARDRSIMEANFERINLWSMLATTVMVITSIIQVFTVRALFNSGGVVAKVFEFLDR